MNQLFLAAAFVASTLTFAAPSGAQTFELERGVTRLAVSDELLDAAAQLGVTITPNSPATLVNGVASFPVSGGAIDGTDARGEIAHRGGLTLSAGGTEVDLIEFLIDTTDTPELTALAVINAGLEERIRLLRLTLPHDLPLPLEPANRRLTITGIDARLTLEGAVALNNAFGIDAFGPGFPIGTAATTVVTQLDFLTDFVVEPERYAGLWFELGRTPNFFEDNTPVIDGEQFSRCFNATAEYTIEGPDRIGITNRCTRVGEQGGEIEESVSGAGLIEPGSGARKLKIAFGGPLAQLFQRLLTGGGAPYWIYCLGPVNSDGLYDWAVVSGPQRDYIFLLTRDQFVSPALREEIVSCAAAEGLPVDQLIFTQRP